MHLHDMHVWSPYMWGLFSTTHRQTVTLLPADLNLYLRHSCRRLEREWTVEKLCLPHSPQGVCSSPDSYDGCMLLSLLLGHLLFSDTIRNMVVSLSIWNVKSKILNLISVLYFYFSSLPHLFVHLCLVVLSAGTLSLLSAANTILLHKSTPENFMTLSELSDCRWPGLFTPVLKRSFGSVRSMGELLQREHSR